VGADVHGSGGKATVDPAANQALTAAQTALAAAQTASRATISHLRAVGRPEQAASLKGSRRALVKNAGDLTGEQKTTLAAIAVTNKGLYRAYLLVTGHVLLSLLDGLV